MWITSSQHSHHISLYCSCKYKMRLADKNLAIKCPSREVGGFRVVTGTKSADTGAMINQPWWRLQFFQQNPHAIITYSHAPQRRRVDPTFCPIPRRRTWSRFFDIKQIHGRKQWLNYPAMPPPVKEPTLQYFIKTLKEITKKCQNVPDLTCKMMVKIADMLIAVTAAYS